jgi:hypothetical protein
MTKSDKKDSDNKNTEGQATDAQGNVLPPGSVVPNPSTAQDPKLAEKGIYQPADQAANAPQVDDPVDEEGVHAEHRENLTKLPPVPAERAGAASQAK